MTKTVRDCNHFITTETLIKLMRKHSALLLPGAGNFSFKCPCPEALRTALTTMRQFDHIYRQSQTLISSSLVPF